MLKEGDVIEIKDGMSIYANIPKDLIFKNGESKLFHHKVTIGEDDKFDYLSGEYIVYDTTYDGGGTGHGPHDIYPDGHHVFCRQISNRDIKIDFYQSGAFTAMIEEDEIEPIGRTELE